MDSTGCEQTPRNSVIKALHTLRNDKTTFDCLIKCKKKEFLSHQLVVSACIPDIHSALATTRQDKSSIAIDLRAVIDGDAMAVIIDYMYTGIIPNITANVDLLQEVVSASHYLKMVNLFLTSLGILSEKLSATNIEKLLQLSLIYSKDGLESKIISHLKNKFCHLGLRDDFLSLSALHVRKILTHFGALSECKTEIHRAFTAWINVDNERRRGFPSQCAPLASFDDEWQTAKGVLPHNEAESSAFEMDTTGKTKLLEEKSSFVESQQVLIFRIADGHTSVVTYDVEKDKWSTWKHFPVDVNEDGVTVAYRNHIYFMGGWTNKAKLSVSSIVYDYCLNMNVLSTTSQLCFPIVYGSAGGLNDQIYIVGGWGGTEKEKSSRRVQRYNVLKRECQEISQTNEKYLRARMVSFKNFLYIADKGTIFSGNLERYDPLTDQWTFVTSLDIQWFNVAFSDYQMFVMGPYADATLNVFDMTLNVWLPGIRFEDGPNGIYGFWSAVKGNRPILIAQSRDHLWYTYDIQSSTWEKQLFCPALYEDYVAVVVSEFIQPTPISQSGHPVLSSLNCYRRRLNMTDVTLECGSQKLGAHLFVLSAALPYFRTMFSSGFSEAESKIVRFPNMRAEVMEVVLTFLYTGAIQEDDTQDLCFFKQLLEISHLMEITELYKFSLQKLPADLTLHNFQEIERIADLYDSPVLKCLVSTLLAKNFPVLVHSDDFLLVSGQQLKRVLQHPELKFSLEPNYMVERFLQWCQYDFKNREPFFYNVISLLGFKQCSEKKSNILKTVRKLVARLIKPDLSEILTQDHVVCIISWLEGRLEYLANKNFLVSLYNPNTKKISGYRDIPVSLVNGMSAVGFGSYVYFYGGGNLASDSARLIYQYCPFTHTIISQDTLELPVKAGGAVVLDDTIYVVGSSSVQRYTPACASCEVLSKTNHAHRKPFVFGCRSKVFVFSCSGVRRDGIMEQYSPLTDQWTMVSQLQSPGQANYIAVRNEIFYFGTTRCVTKCIDYGYGRPGGCFPQCRYFTEIYRYDFNACKWSTIKIEKDAAGEKKYAYQTSLEETMLLEGGFPSCCGFVMADIVQWCRVACLSQNCHVLYTDRIRSEFAFPILLRLNPIQVL